MWSKVLILSNICHNLKIRIELTKKNIYLLDKKPVDLWTKRTTGGPGNTYGTYHKSNHHATALSAYFSLSGQWLIMGDRWAMGIGRVNTQNIKHMNHIKQGLIGLTILGHALEHNVSQIFQLMCKNTDDCRMSRVFGQKKDKFRTGVQLLSHFCPAYMQKER